MDDDRLGSRLDSALHDALDGHQVDVETLVQGSRHQARRIRTRRFAAATVTAGLIIGVPVGYEVINPGAGSDAPSAVLLPSGPARNRSGAPPSNPAPTAVPSAAVPSATGSAPAAANGVPPNPAPIAGTPTAIPGAFAFTQAELPDGLRLVAEAEDTPAALVAGQDCTRIGSGPTATRSWTWSGNQGAAEALSVSLNVTGWAPTEAGPAFTAAIAGAGGCRWQDPQQPRPLAGVTADQTWASTSERDGQHYARVVVRVAGGIAGIEVRAANRSAAAVALADRLARIEARRLRTGF
jgi:hypothetical protein